MLILPPYSRREDEQMQSSLSFRAWELFQKLPRKILSLYVVADEIIITFLLVDDKSGLSGNDGTIFGNVLSDDAICAYPCIIAYCHVTDNFSAAAYIHIIADNGSALSLAVRESIGAYCHLMKNYAVFTYFCSDGNKYTVISVRKLRPAVKLSIERYGCVI